MPGGFRGRAENELRSSVCEAKQLGKYAQSSTEQDLC